MGSDTYLAQSANLPSQARLAARQLAQATLGRPRFDCSGCMDADADRRSERYRGGSGVTHPVGREDRRLGIIFRCPSRLAGVRVGGRASPLLVFPCREQSTPKIKPEKYSPFAGPTQACVSRVGRPPSARAPPSNGALLVWRRGRVFTPKGRTLVRMGGRPGAPRALAVPTGPLGSAGPPQTAETIFSCILERLTENWLAFTLVLSCPSTVIAAVHDYVVSRERINPLLVPTAPPRGTAGREQR